MPCGEDNSAYAYSYTGTSDEMTDCITLTDSSFYTSNAEVYNSGEYVTFTYGGGDECGDDLEESSITYLIYCDSDVTETLTSDDFTVDETDECNPIRSFTHNAGCPVFTLSTVVIFL